ncbi:MAG: hypothetical protein LBU50_06870 [Cellulomonas sp.]|nr:hypothetical protein [Cellulomonas sp.]
MSGVGQFLDAIGKLPPAGGVTFRGLDDDPASVAPLGVLAGVVSTSRDPRVATENFTSRSILVLLNRTGRDVSMLSAHPREGEVVVRPGSVWHRLADVGLPQAPAPVVVLEEVDPAGYSSPVGWPATRADLTQQLDAQLRAAQQQEPVQIARPGVFVGPWPARTQGVT